MSGAEHANKPNEGARITREQANVDLTNAAIDREYPSGGGGDPYVAALVGTTPSNRLSAGSGDRKPLTFNPYYRSES